MSTPPTAPIIPPDLLVFVQKVISDQMSGYNFHQLGTIQSFNAAKQTATVSLNVLLTVAGVVKPYPTLVDVPVFVFGGGNRVFTFPVKKGDTCLVVFNDRDIDAWFASGSTVPTNSPRVHDLSDGLAFIGFRSSANPIANYSEEDSEIRNGGSSIRVGEKFLIQNSSTDIKAVLQSITTALTTLNAVKLGSDATAQIEIANARISELFKSP